MSAGSSSTSTTSQTSAPWSPMLPYLTDLGKQASDLYAQQKGQTYYPDKVAEFSPWTQTALDNTWQRASNGSPLMNSADQTATNLMSQQNAALPLAQSMAANGPNLSATAINPHLDQMFQAQSQPVIDSVNSIMGQAGRTGSGAQQQLLTRNLSELAGNVYGSNYLAQQQMALDAYNAQQGAVGQLGSLSASDMGRQLSAAGMAPGLANQDYADLQNLLSVGGAYDAYNQNVLNNQFDAWQYGQQNPWDILNSYGGVVSGLGALGGTTSGTSTGKQTSSLAPSIIGAVGNIGAAF